MEIHERLSGAEGFDWDAGNIAKNGQSHRVSSAESEQLCFNQPLVVAPDDAHSNEEERFFALGQSDAGRHLFIVFTVRANRIRVISAREMSRRERKVYESHG